MEICGSMAEARRYNSSASGWSRASDRTRAMTRRWSVILRPLSTQAFSIRVTIHSLPTLKAGRLGQIPRERKPEDGGITALIIALAHADLGKAQAGIKGQGRDIVACHFQKHGLDPHLLRLRDGGGEQGASQPLATRRGG